MVVVSDVSMLLRALKGPELACLFAILISPEPAKVYWLESVTGMSAHTVANALKTLQSLGLAEHDSHRSNWLPAGGFCEAFLRRAVEGPGVGERPVNSPPVPSSEAIDGTLKRKDEKSSQRNRGILKHSDPQSRRADRHRGNRQTAVSGPAKKGAANRGTKAAEAAQGELSEADNQDHNEEHHGEINPGDSGSTAARSGSAIRVMDLHNANRAAVFKEEEIEKVNNNHLTSSSDSGVKQSQNRRSEQNATPDRLTDESNALDGGDRKARLRRILAATQLLFGEMVLGPPERYPDLDLLLGSIAEAYSRRVHLRNPARVVYTNLKDGTPPAQKFLTDPLGYLPVDFLHAAGLLAEGEGEPDVGSSTTGAGSWEELSSELQGAESGNGLCLPDESVDLPVNCETDHRINPSDGNRRSARQAWQTVRASLLIDMPLSNYQRFIEPLMLVRFEAGECIFTLQVQDEYSAQWLEERMRRILVHLLSGICNRPAQVVIVSYESPDF